MINVPFSDYKEPYKLLRRFEALIESIFALNATIRQLGFVRYKPLFSSYISCIEAFKSLYLDEYENLGLEELKLYDSEGKYLFTTNKLSTVLHQSQAVIGVLKGHLPPAFIENPGGITILVSSQASSQSSAKATAQIQFTLVMEGLGDAIQNSDLDQTTKDELISEIENLKNLQNPDDTKIKAFATKLGKKLQEIGENVAIGVIDRWLKSQIGM